MEVKWLSIFGIVVFGGMFVGMGFSEYHNNQCRIEGIRAGLTADVIVKTCGKP